MAHHHADCVLTFPTLKPSAAIRQALAKSILAYYQKCTSANFSGLGDRLLLNISCFDEDITNFATNCVIVTLFGCLIRIADVDEQSKNDLKEIYMQHDRSLLVSGLIFKDLS